MLEDGSIRVWATVGAGHRACVGRLMPQFSDSRQQPKSGAAKLIEQRVQWRRRSAVLAGPAPRRRCVLHFERLPGNGAIVSMRGTGQCIGTVLPTISDAVLAASPGIQSWSRAGATNTPTQK